MMNQTINLLTLEESDKLSKWEEPIDELYLTALAIDVDQCEVLNHVRKDVKLVTVNGNA